MKKQICIALAGILALALIATTSVPTQAEPTATTQSKKTTRTTKTKPKAKARTGRNRGEQGSSSKENTHLTYTPQNKTYTVNGITFTMVEVRGGTFTMGATEEQGSEAWQIELPTHKVTLPSYYIGQTEVTCGLWETVMGYNPTNFIGGDDTFPVDGVSWNDVQTFISKLNSMTGMKFRLPTEAEWEFAARGGTMSKGYKYSGSNHINVVAWYYENLAYENGPTVFHSVGTRAPNELGIYDMSGNVVEWCQDWYTYWTSSKSVYNPTGPKSGYNRVCRGGCVLNDAKQCRVSFRGDINRPDEGKAGLGFRLAM